jgi:alcohol dehydrogenase class IV
LLPAATAVNISALRARAPQSAALAAYAEAARLVTGQVAASAPDLVAWLYALVESLPVPRLAAYGVTDADLPELIPLAQRASSMRGNPLALTDAEVGEILQQSL